MANPVSRQEFDNLKSVVQDLQKTISSQKGAVAFFARLSPQYLENLGARQNIVFDEVVTNIGNGYSNHQGVFTVPVCGLFLVTASLLSTHDREFWADIMVNGETAARLNGRGTDGRHGSGTQTVIKDLKKGDVVSVQNLGSDGCYYGDRHSCYGGFLIKEH